MRISAKVDYAVRAAVELGAAQPGDGSRPPPVKGDALATAQAIPIKFLENILAELKHAGLVGSQRGAEGGYWLAQPAAEVSVADLIRAVEGPLANVRGVRPEAIVYEGTAVPLQRMWVSVRAGLRAVLEQVTVADLVAGSLPAEVDALADGPDAWKPH
ncbi:Rrf2 family transcriptional regulator [soil metagenome]